VWELGEKGGGIVACVPVFRRTSPTIAVYAYMTLPHIVHTCIPVELILTLFYLSVLYQKIFSVSMFAALFDVQTSPFYLKLSLRVSP
jgi:hypothetical protein